MIKLTFTGVDKMLIVSPDSLTARSCFLRPPVGRDNALDSWWDLCAPGRDRADTLDLFEFTAPTVKACEKVLLPQYHAVLIGTPEGDALGERGQIERAIARRGLFKEQYFRYDTSFVVMLIRFTPEDGTPGWDYYYGEPSTDFSGLFMNRDESGIYSFGDFSVTQRRGGPGQPVLADRDSLEFAAVSEPDLHPRSCLRAYETFTSMCHGDCGRCSCE